jgi:hypothetical protein
MKLVRPGFGSPAEPARVSRAQGRHGGCGSRLPLRACSRQPPRRYGFGTRRPAAQLIVRSVSQTLGSAMRRIAMVGCGLRSAVVNGLWRVYAPDGERVFPPARERRYARAIRTSSHGTRTLAPVSKPAARPEQGRGTRRSRLPRFEAALLKLRAIGHRRSARRLSHESHRWFTRLARDVDSPRATNGPSVS